jgi:hypothetical protein
MKILSLIVYSLAGLGCSSILSLLLICLGATAPSVYHWVGATFCIGLVIGFTFYAINYQSDGVQ